MKLKRALAAVTAIGLTVSALALGGAAATAVPSGDVYLPAAEIVTTTDAATESQFYNQWHFDPEPGSNGVAAQHPNGFTVAAGGVVHAIKGNHNDLVGPGEALADPTSIAELASSLSLAISDPSRTTYQIPVFYGHDGAAWKFTMLRKNVAHDDNRWISSATIPAEGSASEIRAEYEYPLAQIIAALEANGDPRAIGAGFFVDRPTSELIVSSFTASGVTTRFYAAPPTSADPRGTDTGFVHADSIYVRAELSEDAYAGWHEEVEDAAVRGTFESVVAPSGDHITGLRVTGKSQLINGYADDARPRNSLPQILDEGFVIDGAAETGARGFEAQIPVFFQQEGRIGQQFTTLRAAVPADGRLTSGLPWASSRDLGAVPADTYTDLNSIIAALGDYEIIGHGFTVEAGTALVKNVSFNGHATTFATAPAPIVPAPKPSDLTPETEGRISAAPTAAPGATITIEVGAEWAGQTVDVYIFSEPRHLGAHLVSAAGTVEVVLPADMSGVHSLAVYAADGTLIGWQTITLASGGGAGGAKLARTGAEETAVLGTGIAALAAIVLGGAAIGSQALRRRSL